MDKEQRKDMIQKTRKRKVQWVEGECRIRNGYRDSYKAMVVDKAGNRLQIYDRGPWGPPHNWVASVQSQDGQAYLEQGDILTSAAAKLVCYHLAKKLPLTQRSSFHKVTLD